MSTIRIADKPTLDNVDSNVETLLSRGGVKYNSSTHKPQVYDITNDTWVNLDTGGGGGGGDGSNVMYVTQAEYDDLPDSKLSDGIAYCIIDYDDAYIIKIPTISEHAGYNGKPQTAFRDVETFKLTISGDDMYQTNVGSYTTTFTPKQGYTWADGTTAAKTFNWNIVKGKGFITLSEYDLTGKNIYKNNYKYKINVEKTSNSNFYITSDDPTIIEGYNQDGNIILQSQGNLGKTAVTVVVPENSNYLSTSARIINISTIEDEGLTFTVKLDLNNSEPTSWGSYDDDAEGLQPCDPIFDNVFGYYPCILENGVELGRLDPNDFSKYEDGTPAPIEELGKDVMICFPRRGYKISKSGDILTVSITREDNKYGYSYKPFTYMDENQNPLRCDKFYIGAYQGFIDKSSGDTNTYKMYSSSNKIPSTSFSSATSGYVSNLSLSKSRIWAYNRGDRYTQFNWYPLVYLQCLYLIKYRGQNARVTLGYGMYSNYTNTFTITGLTNTNGMDYGSGSSVKVKLFGIEDFYGCWQTYIDGYIMHYDPNESTANKYKIYSMIPSKLFSDTALNYNTIFQTNFNITNGYFLRYPIGNNDGAFDMASVNVGGNSNYYFASYIYPYRTNSSGYYIYSHGGGYGPGGDTTNVFGLYTGGNTSTSAASYSGCRLMYFHKEG